MTEELLDQQFFCHLHKQYDTRSKTLDCPSAGAGALSETGMSKNPSFVSLLKNGRI